jgi:L,D-peptidoglycan transpeptidase YkuD (ErfK/YbiS/YcfS/YnhG family)
MITLQRWFTLFLAFLLPFIASMSMAGELPWSGARQLVVVTTADWNSSQGTLQTFVKSENAWQPTAPGVPITIGREGAAWGVGLHPTQAGPAKKEGDGRSPAGVFRIGSAFGYADSVRTALPYKAMSATHYCVDVSTSPLYNRIVDANVVGKKATEGSTEPMRRDIHVNGDHRYKLGFVIEHNSSGGAALGSCIFAHLWNSPGEPTSGCTAMDESAMQALLDWLQPAENPVFVLLPQQEYARLQVEWNLPALTQSQ